MNLNCYDFQRSVTSIRRQICLHFARRQTDSRIFTSCHVSAKIAIFPFTIYYGNLLASTLFTNREKRNSDEACYCVLKVCINDSKKKAVSPAEFSCCYSGPLRFNSHLDVFGACLQTMSVENNVGEVRRMKQKRVWDFEKQQR